jgi:hypothetical protein
LPADGRLLCPGTFLQAGGLNDRLRATTEGVNTWGSEQGKRAARLSLGYCTATRLLFRLHGGRQLAALRDRPPKVPINARLGGKPISRSHLNDGFRANSGPSRGDLCRRALRPFATFPDAGVGRPAPARQGGGMPIAITAAVARPWIIDPHDTIGNHCGMRSHQSLFKPLRLPLAQADRSLPP